MKKNRMDLVTDGVKLRIKSIYSEIHKQYGNTNPYRQKKVSKREILLDYDDMMSREAQLRQEFGDELVEKYKMNMNKFLGGEEYGE